MIKSNTAGLACVAFFSYMIMSGLLTPIGVIIGPLAAELGISVASAASSFSYLTGGTLLGTMAAMWGYSRYPLGRILQFNYGFMSLVILTLVIFPLVSITQLILLLIALGFCCGLGLSGGAVILSSTFADERHRASAFLATDCSFSLAGYLFPALISMLLLMGLSWKIGYASVGLIATLVIASTLLLRFPSPHVCADESAEPISLLIATKRILTPRVTIIALALCVYLITQTSFTTWSPQYLQQHFNLPAHIAGQAVSNYWGASAFGLLTATFLVTRLPVRAILLVVLTIAISLSGFLMLTQNPKHFLTATLALGFFTSCIFKISISVGSQQIQQSPPVLVTFLLCCATTGSTLAPALSAAIVSQFGIVSAMQTTFVGFILLTILISVCLFVERQNKPQTPSISKLLICR